mgnify:CR=1 FL=1
MPTRALALAPAPEIMGEVLEVTLSLFKRPVSSEADKELRLKTLIGAVRSTVTVQAAE